jgi:hypothetical protein
VDAFLETTAVVDIIFKDSGTKAALESLLKQYEVKYSSQYVRMEIKRGVLMHFVYLHNKAVECSKMSEVHASIARLTSSLLRNKLATVTKAIADFYAAFESVRLSSYPADQRPLEFQKHMLAAFLRVRIKRFWRAFERLADVILDGTECYKHNLPLSPPKFDGKVFDNTLSTCDKFKPGICRVKDFCADNAAVLAEIHESLTNITAPDSETQKRKSAIKDVLRVPGRDILRKACWRMGDAILILEAPAGSAIITSNCKHYDTMCENITRTVICYRPKPPL